MNSFEGGKQRQQNISKITDGEDDLNWFEDKHTVHLLLQFLITVFIYKNSLVRNNLHHSYPSQSKAAKAVTDSYLL